MTVASKVHSYLRDVYTDPLRSNIVKSAHIRAKKDINGTQAGMVLRSMYLGDIEGVELSIYNDPDAGQTRYRIEAVSDTVTGRVYVDAETCAEIRRTLKTGEYTQEDVAEQTDVSPTLVSTHGRGLCSHDIAERPAESVKLGPSQYRYKGVEVEG